jgi:asparagine synthase (glutamine-hydrolysing)
MCGICGVVGFGDLGTVQLMRDTLAHRGPDSAGAVYFEKEKVGLGHRRLRIIDLTPDADQPMTQEDDTIWIVLNGEIFNFADLRQELEARGHRFRSRSDTEVILHLYEEEGTNCFDRLNGMFALALFDIRRGKVVLARDQLGIKPLYYYHQGGSFAFGSEIKVLLASGKYSPAPNWQGLYDYFTFLYVPCPQTAFQGIFQVPPAHALELDVRTCRLRQWRYWRPDEDREQNGTGKNGPSLEETKQELRDLLADSVRRQMVSDVPLGVFLSGGVDSSILTGLMAQASSRPVKTFTVIFHGKDVQSYNEQEAARVVARKFGTEHHEIPVDISNPAEMLNLVEFFDQPFGNPTFYLTYLISRHTRHEVNVALCGAGGDELFAGYPRYRAVGLSRWFRWLPSALLRCGGRASGIAADVFSSRRFCRAQQFLQGLEGDLAHQLTSWIYFFDEADKTALFNPRLQQAEAEADGFLSSERIMRQYLQDTRLEDTGNRVLHVDVQTFLPDNILEYTDKMSMATALEVRVPYLDHRFVERSLRVPFCYKLRGSNGKVILKDLFSDLLPESNRRLPKKGFNAPLAVWMRDRLDGYFDQYMSRAEVERNGILNWDYLQGLRQEHRVGARDKSYELFSILMFDAWYRRYILQP